ncbi:MAG TPA: DNA mismatch repair protein MutS [Thermomicrobiaceae bacterium]|nr:DNA mismatch repair protein MutS [Thermomicrobiaceae bacterium]
MSTPIRRQYLSVKRQYPDVIVFFRLGDFYETFDDDARLAASVLDITLTGREMGRGNRVPMAGIPYHAAQGYIARLIAAGHKVAVCEQLSEPNGRDLVERRVTRVVTPGTVTEPGMLEEGANRYIAAVLVEGTRAGLAVADLSTGEFATAEINGDDAERTLAAVQRELLRLAPAEVVTMPAGGDEDEPEGVPTVPAGAHVSRLPRPAWRLETAREELLRHFAVETLDAYGCGGKPFAVRAAGALLRYLAETQLGSLQQIVDLVTYSVERYMALDAQTRRNLELTESSRGDRQHSLIAVLDQTRTPMGARLLRRWVGQPLLEVAELRERQDAVAFCVERALGRARLREALGHVADVERLINRTVTGAAGPRELLALGQSLGRLPEVAAALGEGERPAGLGRIPDCGETARLIRGALVDEPPAVLGGGPAIRPGFSPELDGLRGSSREAREWIAGLEQLERDRTGIRSLKVGYNKVFGYYLEISNANAGGIPEHYQRKQTLVGAERYVTPELKEYESRVLNAEERIEDLETQVYRGLLAQVAAAAESVRQAAGALARLDVFASLAEVAVRRDYARPEVDEGTALEIVGGRHPVVEVTLETGAFVPNDTRLDTEEQQVAILTGPNMAGKSTYLRQAALIVLMAQIGSFVPAERARVGLVDRIFTRLGAQDDIASGQSTFMVEMVETATILHHATPRSLVVLDEIGRGTSTYDGLAIARAVVEHLHNSSRLGCKTLFATHYHELTELEKVLPRVRNFRVDVLEEGEAVVFLHRVVPGGADRSYGIYVAQLAGMPRPVVRRADEILAELEAGPKGEAERGRRRGAMSAGPRVEEPMQLTFFGAPDPVVEELKGLDVESLSPLEALTRLYELQRRARDGAV